MEECFSIYNILKSILFSFKDREQPLCIRDSLVTGDSGVAGDFTTTTSLSLSLSFLPPSLPPQCFRSGNFALFKDRRLIHSQNNDGHLLSCMDRYRTFVTFLKKTRRTSTTRLVPFHDWVPPFACELAISSSQHSAFIPLKLNLLNMYVKLRDATEISISFSYSRSPATGMQSRTERSVGHASCEILTPSAPQAAAGAAPS